MILDISLADSLGSCFLDSLPVFLSTLFSFFAAPFDDEAMVVDGTAVANDGCDPVVGGAKNEGVKVFAPGLKETFESFSGSAVTSLLNVTHASLEKTT